MADIILRIPGKMPRGKFEITCDCGHYWIEEITDKENKFSCTQCYSDVYVWAQKTHWHVRIQKK